MGIGRLIILAFAALMAAAPATASQQREAPARSSTARMEIERILNADNLDSSRMSPREVFDTISQIEQGRAPDDFWAAYQTHVMAWSNLASIVEIVELQSDESGLDGEAELTAAEDEVEATFDEVERIARRYGARLPAVPIDTRSIT